ncbi:MAG TPA: hypothetical protein VF725_11915 [Ktedonobacterales bacterium]
MWSKKHVALGSATGLGVLALLAGLFSAHGAFAAPTASGPTSSSVQAALVGTASLNTGSGTASGGKASTEFGPSVDEQAPHTSTIIRVPASGVPNPAGLGVVTDSGNGFAGLNHFQQRYAGTGAYAGTQFSLEPPDQALCVGGGYVVESINTAVAVYNTSGALQGGVTPLNQFFGLAPEINRTTGVYGDFTSDPKCYYDSDTGHFFLTMLQIDVDPATGNLNPHSHTYIAVSKTSNPTDKWNVLSFDTTDDGSNGTLNHAGCPCFGDQPLIGADKYGFYITTNEFPIFANGFNGAQVYAFSKVALERGSTTNGVHLDVGGTASTPDKVCCWYSLQPATSPAAQYATANGGTEYLLSALDFSATLDNRVAVWALSNTQSLTSRNPSLNVAHAVIGSEVYGQPPSAVQKSGAIPLADSIKNPLAQIQSNDDRMNQVVYAGGKLWSGVNSVVQTPNGPTRSAIAYFEVAPASGGSFAPTMAGQGYVAVNQENTLYPSIGVNANGGAVMTFTLVGPDYYPSAAYYDLTGGDGNVHIVGAGVGPEDGFTGYKKLGGGGSSRWGDYSAAVAGPDGSIWMATEYIGQTCSDAQFNADTTCGGTRSFYANWGTYIASVQP